jgi:hypothetical protein
MGPMLDEIADLIVFETHLSHVAHRKPGELLGTVRVLSKELVDHGPTSPPVSLRRAESTSTASATSHHADAVSGVTHMVIASFVSHLSSFRHRFRYAL